MSASSSRYGNVQSKFESTVTNGASDWAHGMASASRLPGLYQGPADAYRHLLIAAELHRVYANNSGGTLLWLHEKTDGDLGYGADSAADKYVNDIGRRIGQYVRSQRGTTTDVVRLVNAVMKNSFPGPWQGATWTKVPGAGFKMVGAGPTQLPNGEVLPPVVIFQTKPEVWQHTNPADAQGRQLPMNAVNWPRGDWRRRFEFSNPDAKKALQYQRRNRPIQEYNPMPQGEEHYP